MTIEELLIKLGVDNAGLRSGMASSREEVQHFEKQTNSSMATASRAMDDAGTHSSKLGGMFHALGGAASVFTGMIAAEAVPALIDMGKHAMDLVTAEDAINKQTDAVIKSTGGVANVSAAQVDELASSMMKLTGIDDETIKTTENMLLTFTSVRNEVGKGNDIFTQATQAATDMSVALGEDGKSAAMQLGKALNDPIAGVTALQRVGVKLTETQKEQVKALVESGNTLGAQKVILKELSTEFGGSAQAFGDSSAGAMAKINNSVAEAEKGFAKLVLPMAEAGLQLLPPLIDGVASLSTKVSEMVSSFASLPGVQAIFGGIGGLFGALTSGGDVGAAGGTLMDSLASGIKGALPIVTDAVLNVGQGIFDWLVSTGVPMMATGAGKMFDALAKALPPALLKIGQFIVQNAPVLIGKLGEWGKAFVGWVGERLPSLLASLGDALGKIGAWIINTGLPTLAAKLVEWGQALVAWIGPMIPPAIAALADLIGKIGAWIINPGIPTLVGKMGDLGRAMVAGAMDFLVGSGGKPGMLQGIVGWFTGTLLPALPGLGLQVATGFKDMAVGIGKAFANGLVGLVEGAINLMIGGIDSLQIHFGGLSTPFGNLAKFDWGGLGIPRISLPRMHTGGIVPGLHGADVPIMAQAGERIIPAGQSMGKQVTNNVTVNNPVPEPASSSVQRTLLTLGATGHM